MLLGSVPGSSVGKSGQHISTGAAFDECYRSNSIEFADNIRITMVVGEILYPIIVAVVY